MTILSVDDRVAGNNEYLAERNLERDSLALTKAQIKAAFDAVDVWMDSVQAAFNTAIPQPARGALTTAQKAKLLIAVAKRRHLSGV